MIDVTGVVTRSLTIAGVMPPQPIGASGSPAPLAAADAAGAADAVDALLFAPAGGGAEFVAAAAAVEVVACVDGLPVPAALGLAEPDEHAARLNATRPTPRAVPSAKRSLNMS